MLPAGNTGSDPLSWSSDGRHQMPVTKTTLPPRERILAVADDLFRRHGIRGVGVEAIAEAADTNKMTLYRHFQSKDELIAAWLRGVIGEKDRIWDELEA